MGKASRRNLEVGLAQGIWGFKRHQTDYKQLAPGDLVLLGSGFSGGSPRVPTDEWRAGEVASIEVGVVTHPLYEDHVPAWPDERSGEASYPYRFRFEYRGRVGPVNLGDTGPLGPVLADSLRRSAIAQGRGYVVDGPAGLSTELFDEGGHGEDEARTPTTATHVEAASVEEVVTAFERQLDAAGLRFPPGLALRFLCGLLAKPFVIFTGLSARGRPSLGISARTVARIPRGCSSWPSAPTGAGAEALFGYENLLLPSVRGRSRRMECAARAAFHAPGRRRSRTSPTSFCWTR